jgi:hypothetical protein
VDLTCPICHIEHEIVVHCDLLVNAPNLFGISQWAPILFYPWEMFLFLNGLMMLLISLALSSSLLYGLSRVRGIKYF